MNRGGGTETEVSQNEKQAIQGARSTRRNGVGSVVERAGSKNKKNQQRIRERRGWLKQGARSGKGMGGGEVRLVSGRGQDGDGSEVARRLF